MIKSRKVWVGIVPIFALALALTISALRPATNVARPELKARSGVVVKTPAESFPVYPPEAPPPPPGPKASEQTFGKAYEEVYFRDCFLNYWSAVAQESQTFQQMYLPILLKDRPFALRLAQDQVEKSDPGPDRRTSQRVLDELRR